ncbi:hypothetical protein CC86DRAFT_65491 [Ophiobolus disseminans]|uniref:Uncharacterized protein n=1 Tax=Ophiobolus disseminans TaxID=1469910 RepID=A0A6A6ZQ98_9PLEO|nr:hypothetical protein CC86DRAFT_65491 [Ophiobolus disseminans]
MGVMALWLELYKTRAIRRRPLYPGAYGAMFECFALCLSFISVSGHFVASWVLEHGLVHIDDVESFDASFFGGPLLDSASSFSISIFSEDGR